MLLNEISPEFSAFPLLLASSCSKIRARASAYFFSFSLRVLLVLIAETLFFPLLLPLEPCETLLERFMIFIFPTFLLPFMAPFPAPIGGPEAEEETLIS